MPTYILVSIFVCLFGFIVWFFGTAGKRESKRISTFLDKWGKEADAAITEVKSLQDSKQFFSDDKKNTFKKTHSSIFLAYQTLKKPKDESLKASLHKFEVFAAYYESIDKIQVNNNTSYFSSYSETLCDEYSAINTQERFVGFHEVEDFKNKWKVILSQFASLSAKDSYSAMPLYPILLKVSKLNSSEDALNKQRLLNNQEYKENELFVQNSFFDTLLSYPLDHQQRQAIITNEDNTLVVSSAGSGKTSTIIGKVRYLVSQKNIAPEDILVVTYTRKAAGELRERLGIDGVTCSTFHKHAMDTMGLISGTKPTITDQGTLLNIFDRLTRNDKSFLEAFNKYATELTNLIKDDNEYKSSVEHAADAQKYGLRSPYLDGSGQRKKMKSKQEIQISVILTHLGVDFRYEEPYVVDTSNAYYRQYRPDFVIHYKKKEVDANGRESIVEKVLYYEHFGVDSNGFVPSWFGDGMEGGWQAAQKRYSEGIAWKRSLHAQYGTELMETTSADFSKEPDIEAYIENLLHKYGVPTRHISEEEKRKKLLEANSQIDSGLFNLVQGFITLMKANRRSINEVVNRIGKDDINADRNKYVLEQLVKPVFDQYQSILQENGEYDFTDVLLETATLCEEKNPYSYKYILVDEFQDISMDKYVYLKSLRRKDPFTTLFCVGDDWQSIYRFSGSDMTLFYDFEKYFGYTEECKIETTHRFSQPLLNASTVFILSNPEQKDKIVTTTNQDNTLITFHPYFGQEEYQVVEDIVKSIPKDESIILLGRYRFNAGSLCAGIKSRDPKEQIDIYIGNRIIRFLTVHSAKGLEADHVIILDCESGTYGFPSLIADDPILEYVLSGADSYEYSEERRVFYVAITRARKHTYCLFDKENPSPFMTEFGEYSKYQDSTEAICPRCHRGYVRVVKTGTTKYGKPYVTVNCTNASCDYFETIFGDAIYKYQSRQVLKTYALKDMSIALGITHLFLDCNSRTYCLIKRPEGLLIPLVIAPNIVVNKHLFEDLNRAPEHYEVSAIPYFDSTVLVLKKISSEVYISNEDVEISLVSSKNIAAKKQLSIIDNKNIISRI